MANKFNFHQSITEINRNGFVLYTLRQDTTAGIEWSATVVNEEGTELTEYGKMPLDALGNVINAIHAIALSQPPVEEDDGSDLV